MRNNDCSAGPLDVDVRAQATGNLAAALTKQLDNTIAAEITNRLGNGCSLESLAGRLERKVFPSGIEVLALDGQDMLELHPVRFEQSTEGGSIKIKAVQDYRVLRSNAKG